jgi:hypothetical protein
VARGLLEVLADLLVGAHPGARRRGDLQEDDLTVAAGVPFASSVFEGCEALRQPLAVVEAIDADDELRLPTSLASRCTALAISSSATCSSASATSMPIGKAPTTMFRPSACTVPSGPRSPPSRAALRPATKFSQSWAVWKPTTSYCVSARSRRRCPGRVRSTSKPGKGTCRKNPIGCSIPARRNSSARGIRW